jgi:hypothetical protein
MRALLLLLAGAILHAQTPRADRIIPWLGEVPLMLAPGMLVSIYGSNLGPLEGCRGYGDQQRVDILPPDNPFHIWERLAIYPTSLCNVQVMLGDAPAGLLWVQADQINFQVPKEVPFEAAADLRIIHAGIPSDPVPLRFGLERMTITQDEPAHAGGPVWVRVHTSADLERPIQYPVDIDPLSLPCQDIEVRRNNVALPRQTPKQLLGRVLAGNLCGIMGLPGKPSKPGRLPLHVFYRFDQPGTYEVRFTRMQGDAKIIRDRTGWTPIEVGPPVAHRIPPAPASATEMLTDYLPSIIGYGDPAALPLLVQALKFPDESVRQFARYAIADYYDSAVWSALDAHER